MRIDKRVFDLIDEEIKYHEYSEAKHRSDYKRMKMKEDMMRELRHTWGIKALEELRIKLGEIK